MEMSKKTKIITVLLTRRHDRISNIIYWISGRGYTHASISIDNEQEIFYSFNFKGLCIEHFSQKDTYKRKSKSVCYHLEVSEATYNEIHFKISEFIDQRVKYKYSRIGLILCILRIPHKIKNRYFCSQFVAELLSISDEIHIKRRTSLYLPNQFVDELEGQKCLCNISYG
ncbi:hypothetical protein [Clostridium intestinale]|uniref:hypothetical protein n=1 Tax=Clostridium intestinale TaxID=36845 RepID=UPI0028F0AB0F|nr:hypothetical protein [Clostridium intestinale]